MSSLLLFRGDNKEEEKGLQGLGILVFRGFGNAGGGDLDSGGVGIVGRGEGDTGVLVFRGKLAGGLVMLGEGMRILGVVALLFRAGQ